MTTTTRTKRKAPEAEEPERNAKRVKTTMEGSTSQSNSVEISSNTAPAEGHIDEGTHGAESEKKKGKRRATIEEREQDTANTAPGVTYRKLAPPRPFPTVPTSVSATGPRSAHTEGKNYICITRRTPLGAYLRRCKEVILKDGHKTLHLSAIGPAIPHLMQLAVSLPDILPFAPEEVHTEILTGTVELQDEVIPEDEDEDISYRTRGKSTVSVVIRIGDGVDEGPRTGKGRKKSDKRVVQAAGGRYGAGNGQKQNQRGRGGKDKRKQPAPNNAEPEQVVVRVEDMENL